MSCVASTTHQEPQKTDVQEKPIQEKQLDIKQRAEQLKKVYQKLSSTASLKIFEQEYFDSFPNSFLVLNNLFGYTDKNPMGKEFKPGPLYDESMLYTEAFFKLNQIEESHYCNKIIDISINGRWYADGINYFQNGMKDKFRADINSFCELLLKRNDKDIRAFWFFYFDGPHPPDKLPGELSQIKQINQRIYKLMGEGLTEVQKVNKE